MLVSPIRLCADVDMETSRLPDPMAHLCLTALSFRLLRGLFPVRHVLEALHLVAWASLYFFLEFGPRLLLTLSFSRPPIAG